MVKHPKFEEKCSSTHSRTIVNLVTQLVKNLPVAQRHPGSIPGLGRSPGEGNGNPFQYPCLENLMDRGAW